MRAFLVGCCLAGVVVLGAACGEGSAADYEERRAEDVSEFRADCEQSGWEVKELGVEVLCVKPGTEEVMGRVAE